MDAKMSSFFLHEKLMSLRSTVSTVAQKCHGNFNFTHGNFNLLTAISTLLTAISILLTAISILLTAISIYSRQFRSFTHGNFNFTHGNFNFTHSDFNILTAISQFYSRQFQFSHGNAHGVFRFSHHLSATAADRNKIDGRQNAKSKVDS